MNGVAHCVPQSARHLVARGHSPLVVAPATARGTGAGADPPGAVPRRPRPLPPAPWLPLQARVALPSHRGAAAIVDHRADIVHLAGPFVLGVRGLAAAARLGVPAVAIYRTGLAGYARTCTGLLPQLLAPAAAEVRHEARGAGARPDLSASHAVAAAPAAPTVSDQRPEVAWAGPGGPVSGGAARRRTAPVCRAWPGRPRAGPPGRRPR